MELLLITATRLKIVMTSEDMEKYEITCDSLDYDENETKHAIRNILDEAKHKVGFDAKGMRVFVQVFPSKDGGCEMYVTKAGTDRKSGLPMPIHTGAKEVTAVFRFSSVSMMVQACRHLENCADILESKAFSDLEGDACYLLLTSAERDVFGREPLHLSVANEYGIPLTGNYGRAYLTEHCDCICGSNAVHILGSLS